MVGVKLKLKQLPYRNVHFWLIATWIVLTPVTFLTPLKDSVTWVIILSLYANIEASAAALAASRSKSDTPG